MPNDLNVNAYLVNTAGLVSSDNPIPTSLLKAAPVTLFGGAISASVTEANATVIDMAAYTGGSLDVTVNSGTGTFSIAVMTNEANSGVFHQMDKMKSDGSAMEDFPAIVTTASTSKSYSISGVRGKYLKFVPTLTGTANVTIKFTPSVF